MDNYIVSKTSCNEHEFENAKANYEQTLAKSGFKKYMKFKNSPKPKMNRPRNIILFNPPFSKSVKTGNGKKSFNFLKNISQNITNTENVLTKVL